MNLLCPHCQKLLTIPDHLAGQPVQCALCKNTFLVPALLSAPPPSPGSPPELPSTRPPLSGSSGATLPNPTPGNPTAPLLPSALTEPSFPQPTKPSEAHAAELGRSSPSAQVPLSEPPPEKPTTQAPLSTLVWSCTLQPRVLRWVPSCMMLLVLVLFFFPWVGLYAGKTPLLTQSGMQAAFNSATEETDLLRASDYRLVASSTDTKQAPRAKLSVNGITLLYLTLTIVCVLLAFIAPMPELLPFKLPTAVQQLLPRRWQILAALCLVGLVLFVLQAFTSFSLESVYSDHFTTLWKQAGVESTRSPEMTRRLALEEATARAFIQRTNTLTFIFCLQMLAVVSAVLMVWLEDRSGRPLPNLQLHL